MQPRNPLDNEFKQEQCRAFMVIGHFGATKEPVAVEAT
jgi:hypothetical protein